MKVFVPIKKREALKKDFEMGLKIMPEIDFCPTDPYLGSSAHFTVSQSSLHGLHGMELDSKSS